MVTETSSDPALARAIREHAQVISGFVRDGAGDDARNDGQLTLPSARLG